MTVVEIALCFQPSSTFGSTTEILHDSFLSLTSNKLHIPDLACLYSSKSQDTCRHVQVHDQMYFRCARHRAVSGTSINLLLSEPPAFSAAQLELADPSSMTVHHLGRFVARIWQECNEEVRE